MNNHKQVNSLPAAGKIERAHKKHICSLICTFRKNEFKIRKKYILKMSEIAQE